MKKSLYVIACLLIFSKANTQTFGLAEVKAQMVKDWERAKAYTIEYLNTMPADKYSYKPNDSVRTFSGHMLHLATVNAYLIFLANDLQPPSWLSREMQTRPSAQSRDSVLYYINASYDFAINAVQNSDINKWGEIKQIMFTGSVSATRFALMNKAFEHQEHHRSQTTVYIRMLGIKPPQERLF